LSNDIGVLKGVVISKTIVRESLLSIRLGYEKVFFAMKYIWIVPHKVWFGEEPPYSSYLRSEPRNFAGGYFSAFRAIFLSAIASRSISAVKRQNGGPATGLQAERKIVQERIQRAELVVHGDSEGLENAANGVILRGKDFHDLANHNRPMCAGRRFAAGDHLVDVGCITLRRMLFILFRKVSRILPPVPRPSCGFVRTHDGGRVFV